MLAALELDYVQHLERGYCVNHPDVVAQTKEQVVDRAVKQLLEALQTNGFELDGNILKRGNGWLQYHAGTSKWQYSNDAGVTWQDMGSGEGSPATHIITANYQILSTEVAGDVFVVLSSGVTLTLPVSVPDGSKLTVWSYPSETIIDPDTAGIVTIENDGSIGQSLAFVATSHTNEAIQLVLMTDNGTVYTPAGEKCWVAVSQLGDFEFVV